WFRKAADKGNADAQFRMGYGYLMSRGVPLNYTLARSWLQKSADQGNANAQFALGAMYDEGLGGAKNGETAKRLYEAAARQGHEVAKERLAQLEPSAPIRGGAIKLVCEDSRTKSFVTVDPAARSVKIHGGSVLEYRDGDKQYVRVTNDLIE